MKPISLSILMLLLLVACSKNDDASHSDDSSEAILYPKTLEVLTSDTSGELSTMLKYKYGFNANKKIASIEVEGYFGYENLYFTYGPNGKPKQIEVQNSVTTKTFEFYYLDNILAGFSTGSQDYDIQYNSSTNTYVYVDNGFTNSLTLNDSNDLRRYISTSTNNANTILEMTFDTTKKGIFFNVDVPLNLYTSIVSDVPTMLFASHIPLLEISQSNGDVVDYQNTYDADGFVTESSIILGQEPATLRFEYQEL